MKGYVLMTSLDKNFILPINILTIDALGQMKISRERPYFINISSICTTHHT